MRNGYKIAAFVVYIASVVFAILVGDPIEQIHTYAGACALLLMLLVFIQAEHLKQGDK